MREGGYSGLITMKTTLCEECIARGRYSMTNLKIDLREVKRELVERKNIMASEFQELSDKQSELLKIIMSGDIKCTCSIQ